MSEFSWAMQVALNEILRAKNICDGRVFDDVPTKPEYPFMVFGEITSNRNDADCLDYTVEQMTLEIHSKGNMQKRHAMAVSAEITKILKTEPIIINGCDGFFNVIGDFGRKDVKNGKYNQFLRIEAHLSKA